ncbi:prepilin-type N-terminal cleavage/methylation domain-containing protein [Desulfosediminicola flagellatus]|uniref:prepilin-type N-terminal cleavage/methylation domain-containing protein n=1 Tax=Desulfosediminicola flagellatus TaxID=2569541 RepID=UPI0010AD1031|nr:prepilin-type N-terminal cleavage/methylation domain-containing protein [Desulfosediminicola flagellatus]
MCKYTYDGFARFHTDKASGGQRRRRLRGWLNGSGFTMLELLMVVVILGILAIIAMFAYQRYVYKAEVITAVSDMNTMEKLIYGYTIDYNGVYPPNLAAIDHGGFEDPWGNAYVYQPDLTIVSRTKGGVNINTDYDLYSVGRDGFSLPDIAAPTSLDDIIRAGDGQYKGAAERY